MKTKKKTGRILISKSATKKMSTLNKTKADDFTEEVVYITYVGGGKYKSQTKHEKA